MEPTFYNSPPLPVILWWFIIICMDIRVVFCRRTSATYNAKLLCGRLLRLPSAMDGQQQCSAVVVVAVIIDIQIIIKNYLHFVFCTSCTSRPVSLRINLKAPLGIAGIEEETTRTVDGRISQHRHPRELSMRGIRGQHSSDALSILIKLLIPSN